MLVRLMCLVLSLFLFGCATSTIQPSIVPKQKNFIRFATYNLYWHNHSRNKHNPNSITALIDKINPDIIVLQETYCFAMTHIQKQFKKSHPYQLFRQSNRNGTEDGLGILSKYPIIKNTYFPAIYGWFPGWIYIIKTPQGYLQVLNVHLNPMLVCDDNIGIFGEGLWATAQFRLMEILHYYHYLNPHLPTIVAGDFNESDDGIATNFLKDRGFSDELCKLPTYIKTWSCQFGFFHFTGRYDRIYCSPGLRAKKCQVIQRGYSDHYPVMLNFTTQRKKY